MMTQFRSLLLTLFQVSRSCSTGRDDRGRYRNCSLHSGPNIHSSPYSYNNRNCDDFAIPYCSSAVEIGPSTERRVCQ